MNRRHFLHTSIAAALVTGLQAAENRPRRLLLRSSWQTVNIGDIAHTPGVLRLLEQYLPEAEVRLWPSNVGNGVEQLLRDRFPAVPILKSESDIQTAFDECDFF